MKKTEDALTVLARQAEANALRRKELQEEVRTLNAEAANRNLEISKLNTEFNQIATQLRQVIPQGKCVVAGKFVFSNFSNLIYTTELLSAASDVKP